MSDDDPGTRHAKRMNEQEDDGPIDYRKVTAMAFAIIAVLGLIAWIVFSVIR